MQIQKGIRRNSTLAKFVVGAHPIIERFITLLRIDDAIGTYLPTDKRMKLDDGKALTLLIHNILTTQNALYEMEDWLKPLDAVKLGLQPDQAVAIQDDRIGRALEKFYDCRHKDVFFRLALRAIKIFDLDCRRIHHDTTTVTFVGKYGGWNASEQLNYGKNKDHRPDLKQLVLGLNVTADGAVPISHRIYDGNQTDDRIHPANHQALQRLLGRADFIYVADCKLATKENLGKIAAWHGRFVSVMPRTWKEDELFRQKVRDSEVKWKHILSRPNNRNPDSKLDRYYAAATEHCTACGYHLHWIRSTQKAEQDAETRERRIDHALEQLREIQVKLNTYNLKQRKQISQRVESILAKGHCRKLIRYEIQATRHYKRIYQKKGRPRKGDSYRTVWSQSFTLTFRVDDDEVRKDEKTDGVFPLITNLDPKEHSAKKTLEIYKFQPFLEKRHSQIKTYQEIAPVYLKKAERVVAYLHIHVMALMVASLIERKLRQAMQAASIAALPIYPEGRNCPSPTMFDIVRLFKHVERYEVVVGNEITIFPAELTEIQKKILELLNVPIADYQ